MARVIGIGGIFFKARDPETLKTWYMQHLGMVADQNGTTQFKWRSDDNPDQENATVWSLFPDDTKYFGSGKQPFMVNYIVDDLDGMLAALRAGGATVEEHSEDYDFGRFGWATDPEGNRFELWEPK